MVRVVLLEDLEDEIGKDGAVGDSAFRSRELPVAIRRATSSRGIISTLRARKVTASSRSTK
jgi:hypothetical protein